MLCCDIVVLVIETGRAYPLEHVLVMEHLHLIVHTEEYANFGVFSVSAES